jgi:hypothetical protein
LKLKYFKKIPAQLSVIVAAVTHTTVEVYTHTCCWRTKQLR